MAWILDENTVAIRVLSNQGEGLAPVAEEPFYLGSLDQPHAIAVQLGNYEVQNRLMKILAFFFFFCFPSATSHINVGAQGAGYYDLALAVTEESKVRVFMFSIDEFDTTYPLTQAKALDVYSSASPRLWGADTDTYQRHKYVV